MKKSMLKKLALHKETLRTLHEGLLPGAAGEAPGYSFKYTQCETCGIVGTCDCSGTCLPSDCG